MQEAERTRDIAFDSGAALRLGPDPGGVDVQTLLCEDSDCPWMHLELTPAEDEAGAARCRVRVHTESGEAHVDAAEGPAETVAAMMAELDTYLSHRPSGLLEILRRRWRRARGRGREGWRLRDWSRWRPGMCVSYEEAYPDEPNLLFYSGGTRVWADDAYCISAGCPCRDVVVSFVPTDAEEMAACCALQIDLARGRVTDAETGRAPSADRRALWDDLCAAVPDVRERMQHRRRAMRRIAPEIRRLAGHEAPRAAEPGGPRPGRNDPCPCGSGRKYKRCCL